MTSPSTSCACAGPRAVDADAVAFLAADVGDDEAFLRSALDDGVIAMHRTVRETNVIVLVPSDANGLARERHRSDASAFDREPRLRRPSRNGCAGKAFPGPVATRLGAALGCAKGCLARFAAARPLHDERDQRYHGKHEQSRQHQHQSRCPLIPCFQPRKPLHQNRFGGFQEARRKDGSRRRPKDSGDRQGQVRHVSQSPHSKPTKLLQYDGRNMAQTSMIPGIPASRRTFHKPRSRAPLHVGGRLPYAVLPWEVSSPTDRAHL